MEYILFGEEGGETDLGSLETLLRGCTPRELRHKVGGALCTLRRSGGMETYQQLLGTMDAMEMILMTSDYWGVVHGADPGEAARDEEGMAVAARLGRDMAWMVTLWRSWFTPQPAASIRRSSTHFIPPAMPLRKERSNKT